MTATQSHFLISAPASNSGKTTLTLALLRALKNRGLKVQPFKCGPDYIDTIHHSRAAGRQSINLDTFMASESHVKDLYGTYTSTANVGLTEGVMGLFDGADKMQGSSAEIAHLLDLPVILVVNAKSMAYSAAPLLYGFKNFDKRIHVAGVIFNFVNTESHYRFLKDACHDAGVEPLGYFPYHKEAAIPSRHLGLHLSRETNYEEIIETLAEALPKTADLERLLQLTTKPAGSYQSNAAVPGSSGGNLKITVARDEAFTFLYHQNIEKLSQYGTITWFSPLNDTMLPETDFLYLPGGYPELFAKNLSKNSQMLESVWSYCDAGGIALAECGGLMYLAKTLTDSEGKSFQMAGVLDCSTTMVDAKMKLGYRSAQWNGLEMRGHEFHYSAFKENQMEPEVARITNAKGIGTDTRIYRTKNTYASYMHMYWAEHEDFLNKILNPATLTSTHENPCS